METIWFVCALVVRSFCMTLRIMIWLGHTDGDVEEKLLKHQFTELRLNYLTYWYQIANLEFYIEIKIASITDVRIYFVVTNIPFTIRMLLVSVLMVEPLKLIWTIMS